MNKHRTIAIVCLFSLLLAAACTPSDSSIQAAVMQTQAAWTPIPTQTPLPTHTPYPTYTPPPTVAIQITRIIIVTPTSTPTPLYTPTITPKPTNTTTPTKTPIPTKTPNATQTAQAQAAAKLRADKGDGFYLVNVDIAPGIWRSTGTGDMCYWAVTTKTGKILDNHFGMAGGTAYIPPSGFQVEFHGCGKWVFLSPP